jgi:hypothetical protein
MKVKDLRNLIKSRKKEFKGKVKITGLTKAQLIILLKELN